MPSLNELLSGNSSLATTFTTNNIAIEPLDGPTSVEDVMDRFPEEVYQQGRDSHLYRFLTALCGDAGAGLAKKQAYASRLRYEAEFVNFRVLDRLYAAQFTFQRLGSETYDYDVDVDGLTPTQWDEVQLADQAYYHRMQEWWTATRHGNSPEGIRLAAQAGTGIDCDVVEHYNFVFDQLSDLPLGLKPSGTGLSTGEFVIIPRFLPSTDVAYETAQDKRWVFTPPVLDNTVRPVPVPDPGNEFVVEVQYRPPIPVRADLVSHSQGTGHSVTLPAHRPGDLILISAARLWHEPVAPAASGTVPTWTKQVSGESTGLWLTTFSTVATANNHTSGTFGSNLSFVVAVFRPVNGTISVGAISPVGIKSSDPTKKPLAEYPAWMPDRIDGTSGNYRAASVKTSIHTYLDHPPDGFETIETVHGTNLLPSVANYHRQGLRAIQEETIHRISTENAMHPSVTNSLEIKVTPAPEIIVEPPEVIEEREQEEENPPDGTFIIKEPFWRLLPEIERNAIEMLDRLRPASTVVTFKPEPTRYEEIMLEPSPVASSERLNVNRYVTGTASIPWPEADPALNFFISAGVESEASYYYGMNRDLPIIFLTVENIHAYTDGALSDPTYGTDAFFTPVDGVAPSEIYNSEQIGNYFPVISALFPFVSLSSPDTMFTAEQAFANQNTPLVLEGQVT